MVSRVALALFAARTTHDARFDRRPDDVEVDLGLAGQDAADRIADIGAVEIEPYGQDQFHHVRLAKAGVGAAGTCGGTDKALVNTAQEDASIQADGPRMPLDDFSYRHVFSTSGRDCRVNLVEVAQATRGLNARVGGQF
jgi:hypothetical protein